MTVAESGRASWQRDVHGACGTRVGCGTLRASRGNLFEGEVAVHGARWWCVAARDASARTYDVRLSAERVPMTAA